MNGVERSNDGVVLKKCPFCGGEAILESDVVGKRGELWYVSCKSDCVTQYGYSTTKESAIEKWNNRKPLERVIERLEEYANDLKEDWDKYDNEDDFGGYCAVSRAIEIIKEELM